MFKYNENKQAYIADLDAETYTELVQAAESCQVAVIYQGKPRNAAEQGSTSDQARREVHLTPRPGH